MKKIGQPLSMTLERVEQHVHSSIDVDVVIPPAIDFENTEIAFASKSDEELKKMAWLFKMMNKQWLVKFGSKLGLAAVKMHLPFSHKVVKETIFEQFCVGTSLFESQKAIHKLYDSNIMSILDYGVEAKEREQDFNRTMNENIRAIEFGAHNESVTVVSSKITGLARFSLLEAIQKEVTLTEAQKKEYKHVLKRMDSICHTAKQKGVAVFFDAEESWIQDTIDHLVNLMMRRYNRERVVVYNTFQMYRKDRLQFLVNSYNKARREGYLLGAKLVRGAYMEKERERAEKMGYESPIHPSKAATDDAFNTAVRFCVDNSDWIACCNASHNAYSINLQTELMAYRGIPRHHPHFSFCQLYGMSDNLTFNLAKAGYNVSKYAVYGTVTDVVPYLIRRAEENSSVTGSVGRELELVQKEMKRRGLN